MARALREPIAVQPFLEWCARREDQIRRDLDCPSNDDSPLRRLLAEVGWEGDTGTRRLWRWRHDLSHGLVERADVEDALHRAGADFYDVYSDASRPEGSDRVGMGRLMTDEQVVAAHTVYWQTGLSLRQLSALLWERYGYASAVSCESQLRRAFVNLGLPRRPATEASVMAHLTHGLCRDGRRAALYRRIMALEKHGQCEGVRKDGERCPRAAKEGTVYCGYHQPEEIARRTAQLAAVNAEGKNTLRWANREGVAA